MQLSTRKTISSHPDCYDIIIAGGALAGSALALALRQSDLNIVIIEPRMLDASTTSERVIALSHGSRIYLEKLGIWDDVVQTGIAPIHEIYIHEPGNQGELQMHRNQADIEALGYVVGHDALLGVMHKHLQGRVEIRSPAWVRETSSGENAVRVSIQEKNSDCETLQTSLLIGADGTNSPVRRISGINHRGWDHNRFGIVASVRPAHPHRSVAYECFCRSGPLAFLPLDAHRSSIVWTVKPEMASRMMSASDAEFLDALNQAAGNTVRKHLGDILETGSRTCFPFEFRQATSFTANRVALIGNAAHTMHPIAGQGLNLGLRDVAHLADTIYQAVNTGRDIGGMIALETYRQKRMPDIIAVAAFTEGSNAIFSQDFTCIKRSRGLGLTGLQSIPALRNWLLHKAAGLTT